MQSPVLTDELMLLIPGGLLLAVLMPLTEWGLRRFGRVEANFQGVRIPQSYGLVILVWSSAMLTALAWRRPDLTAITLLQRIACIGFGLLGWIDDVWGTKQIKGLRGHFRAALYDHVLTTGLMKAVGGALLALCLALLLKASAGGFPRFSLLSLLFALLSVLLAAALIALSANAVNLLDLRPGRAAGCFLLAALPLLGAAWFSRNLYGLGLLSVVIPAAAVWVRDARAKVMLGDAGSNLLGGALGLGIAALCPAPVQVAALLLLVGLHIAAERVSLTAVIERTPVLRALDRLTGVRRSYQDDMTDGKGASQ